MARFNSFKCKNKGERNTELKIIIVIYPKMYTILSFDFNFMCIRIKILYTHWNRFGKLLRVVKGNIIFMTRFLCVCVCILYIYNIYVKIWDKVRARVYVYVYIYELHNSIWQTRGRFVCMQFNFPVKIYLNDLHTTKTNTHVYNVYELKVYFVFLKFLLCSQILYWSSVIEIILVEGVVVTLTFVRICATRDYTRVY